MISRRLAAFSFTVRWIFGFMVVFKAFFAFAVPSAFLFGAVAFFQFIFKHGKHLLNSICVLTD